MKRLVLIISSLVFTGIVFAQEADSINKDITPSVETSQQIVALALSSGKAYQDLKELVKIGPRMAGTSRADTAIEWSIRKMVSYRFDYSWKQPVQVPKWTRGRVEYLVAEFNKWRRDTLTARALGFSPGTPSGGVAGQVLEVKSLAELDTIPREEIEGKVVFFNGAMDASKLNTFEAYGEAGRQRGRGPALASYYGAVGAVVRSMTTQIDDYPHTGMTQFPDTVKPIPAVSVSTLDAERLSTRIKEDPKLKLYISLRSKLDEPVISNNAIGEITGSEFTNQYILVGGHIDSWDIGVGAHDNGAGCVQAIEALRLLKVIGYKPKRTLRAVMYMGEEIGGLGGIEYAKMAAWNNEKHIAAIESDRGGFTPRGFTAQVPDDKLGKFKAWEKYLEPASAGKIIKGYGGVDIAPLGENGTLLMGFLPDPQRYFDYHHSELDTIDAVNERELQLGAAAMAIMIMLIDYYGVE